MTRTIITISEEDKKWLSRISRQRKQSVAQTIRNAIAELKRQEGGKLSYKEVLDLTFGIGKGHYGDGVEYQRKLRAEWEKD